MAIARSTGPPARQPCTPPPPIRVPDLTGATDAAAVQATKSARPPGAAIAAGTPPATQSPLDISDPEGPAYDADKTIRANPGIFKEQFHREPRDEPWATQHEVLVQALALQRLREVDPAASIEIECHTAMCMLTVNTKNKTLDDWTALTRS